VVLKIKTPGADFWSHHEFDSRQLATREHALWLKEWLNEAKKNSS
jgi:hypothetical protein